MMEKNIRSFEEYKKEYKRSLDNPERFWEVKANNFIWKKKWDNILSWDFKKPEVKWFEGGKLNITENCLDRHYRSCSENIREVIQTIYNLSQTT